MFVLVFFGLYKYSSVGWIQKKKQDLLPLPSRFRCCCCFSISLSRGPKPMACRRALSPGAIVEATDLGIIR